MVNFFPGFISPEAAADPDARGRDRATARAVPRRSAAQKKALDAWTAANPAPRATIAQVVDHIDHIGKVAGIDHIGIGSDFDGITSVVQGLENVTTYPPPRGTLRRGYSDDDVRKITSRNILRVMRAAETIATRLQSTATPSIKTIEDMDHVTRRGQPVPVPR